MLRRLSPVSRVWGFDRGLPVVRYHIERFLSANTADIQGHVLEIGDNTYTRNYGSSRAVQSDVLHLVEGNPRATGADVHQLPRFLVRDQDGEAFAEQISRYYFQD